MVNVHCFCLLSFCGPMRATPGRVLQWSPCAGATLLCSSPTANAWFWILSGQHSYMAAAEMRVEAGKKARAVPEWTKAFRCKVIKADTELGILREIAGREQARSLATKPLSFSDTMSFFHEIAQVCTLSHALGMVTRDGFTYCGVAVNCFPEHKGSSVCVRSPSRRAWEAYVRTQLATALSPAVLPQEEARVQEEEGLPVHVAKGDLLRRTYRCSGKSELTHGTPVCCLPVTTTVKWVWAMRSPALQNWCNGWRFP